jgi:hypothetical protein
VRSPNLNTEITRYSVANCNVSFPSTISEPLLLNSTQSLAWASLNPMRSSIAGWAIVGGAGGRALAETVNGVPSPPWSVGSDWAQGFRFNFPNGSAGKWWNSGTNPGSAGGSPASAGAGVATAAKNGC